MPKSAALTPRWDRRRRRWTLTLPPKLSPSAKRRREFFEQKDQAEVRAAEIRRNQEASRRVVDSAGPALIRAAVEYDQLFRDVYGFSGGLREACDRFVRRLDEDQRSPLFGDLLKSYEETYEAGWTRSYRAKWKWIAGALKPLSPRLTVGMDGNFWTNWLADVCEEKGWGPGTHNDLLSTVRSVWKHAMGRDLVARNPLEGIRRRPLPMQPKCIYSPDEVRRILHCAWHHDREMVPFFAVAIFAGLRPDKESEIAQLTWDDVNFEERWIRVGEGLRNKTRTKRFVPMEENLRQWLLPWERSSGHIVPRNLTRRRQWILRGKYTSAAGTPEEQWEEVAPSGLAYRDATRHTYGSYLEAKYRDPRIVMANMGHTNIRTFEQHYKNARTPKEADAFWSILPPEDGAPAIAGAPAPGGGTSGRGFKRRPSSVPSKEGTRGTSVSG